jgi:hypothetical protein
MPKNTDDLGDPWLVPVEYQGSPAWFHVDADAGRAYVYFEGKPDKPKRADEEVTHGATLSVSRRHRGAFDRMRLERCSRRSRICESRSSRSTEPTNSAANGDRSDR